MAKKTNAGRKSARGKSSRKAKTVNSNQPNNEEVFKAAEKMAMAAFSSGLKLIAALGAAAAKSASLALESLATGADRFSDLVRMETLQLPDRASSSLQRLGTRTIRRTRPRKTRNTR